MPHKRFQRFDFFCEYMYRGRSWFRTYQPFSRTFLVFFPKICKLECNTNLDGLAYQKSCYIQMLVNIKTIWFFANKTFFMLNSVEHEISKVDKSNLINLLEKFLTCGDFHCFCLSNQSFKFSLPYSSKYKLGFKV